MKHEIFETLSPVYFYDCANVLLWRWVWPVELSCAHSLPVNTVGSSVADHHNVEVNSDIQCYSCADPDSGTKQILNRI